MDNDVVTMFQPMKNFDRTLNIYITHKTRIHPGTSPVLNTRNLAFGELGPDLAG
jgi:hypothetical protein